MNYNSTITCDKYCQDENRNQYNLRSNYFFWYQWFGNSVHSLKYLTQELSNLKNKILLSFDQKIHKGYYKENLDGILIYRKISFLNHYCIRVLTKRKNTRKKNIELDLIYKLIDEIKNKGNKKFIIFILDTENKEIFYKKHGFKISKSLYHKMLFNFDNTYNILYKVF